MSIHLATASYPAPASKKLTRAKYIMAAILVIMAIAQLFAFEKMGTVFAAEVPHSWESFAKLIAAIVVVCEVVALPSLLDVAMSQLARLLSRVASVLTFVLWYFLVLGGMMSGRNVNSGFLGDKVSVTASFLLLLVIMVLFLAMLYVQYLDLRGVTELSPKHKHAKLHK